MFKLYALDQCSVAVHNIKVTMRILVDQHMQLPFTNMKIPGHLLNGQCISAPHRNAVIGNQIRLWLYVIVRIHLGVIIMVLPLCRAVIHRIFTGEASFEMQTKTDNAQLRLLVWIKITKVVLTEGYLQSIIEMHKFICSKTQLR